MLRTITIAMLVVLPTVVFAQTSRPDPYAARVLLGAESYTWESVREAPPVASYPRTSTPVATQPDPHTQRVLDYYGGAQARAALSRMPTQARAPAEPVAPTTPSRPAAKPFNTVVRSPTVSPYLNLFREEQEDAAPNYFAFVRPQQRQIEENRRQMSNLQRIERQVRQATPTPSNRSSVARYGDTGRYYSAWQR